MSSVASSYAESTVSSLSAEPGQRTSLLGRRHHHDHHRHSHRRESASASVARAVAFLSAILSSLCAGSITVFSLYGHIFLERLRYSQYQVNGIAIAASLATYLPVPLMGYVCDRYGPAPLSLFAGVFFAGGYSVAALIYDKTATEDVASSVSASASYICMLAAFVAIGAATCAMYLGAVATCAKNYGRGRHRGLALAAPIAAFGLSGMWLSQFGSRVLYERLPPLPDSGSSRPRRGDVNVFVFFIFLAVLLLIVGLVGTFTLRVVGEDELIDGAVDELERSGILERNDLFSSEGQGQGSGGGRRNSSSSSIDSSCSSTRGRPDATLSIPSSGYGTMRRVDPLSGTRARSNSGVDGLDPDLDEDDALARRLLDPRKNDSQVGGDDGNGGDEPSASSDNGDSEQARRQKQKKRWVLNAETRQFLSDHTMWLFSLGFFLMIGPGEAFINNLGTIIGTLQSPGAGGAGARFQPLPITTLAGSSGTSAATHVSIVGLTGTLVRLLTGSLTDLLAPRPQTQYLQVANRDQHHYGDSVYGGDDHDGYRNSDDIETPHARFTLSRVVFWLAFALTMSAGLVVLASGAVQGHAADRFWVVSALVGAGYGAVFSLTPIIITVIWGVENFGTNWGIVAIFPALGATLWGLLYSAGYQAGVGAGAGEREGAGSGPGASPDSRLCYGQQCYSTTFWAMSASVWVSCLFVLLAWKGRNGWAQRGIVI